LNTGDGKAINGRQDIVEALENVMVDPMKLITRLSWKNKLEDYKLWRK